MVKERFSLSLKQLNYFGIPKILVPSVSAPHGPSISAPTGPHQDGNFSPGRKLPR